MFKNYFVLNRHIVELSYLLSGFSLVEAFTQEKDRLILHFSKENLNNYLEINTDPLLPYLILKNQFSRAKKNTLNFFKSSLPSKLESISIAQYDRIIRFEFHDASIYYLIRGKDTNVLRITKLNEVESFKKLENSRNIANEINRFNFQSAFQIPKLEIKPDENISSIAKNYPFIGKDIINIFECERDIIPDNEPSIILENIMKNIETENPFVYQSESSGGYKLSFFDYDKFHPNKVTVFKNVNDALIFMISEEHKRVHHSHSEMVYEKQFDKKTNQLMRKRNFLLERIRAGSKEGYFRQIGDLIMMNLDKINTGMEKIEIEHDAGSNRTITIQLNPKLKPSEQASQYFEKAKKEHIEFIKTKQLLDETEEKINKLKSSYDDLKHDLNNKITSTTNSLKNKVSQKSSEIKNKFRRFTLYEKYDIYVGKNSKNNDELTTQFAKPNDFWFHARSVSGSHVVLRADKSTEIQKIVLEKTASIAAYYSKAKTSGLVPVSYTQKKYVIKKKGMDAGKVYLLKEKVLIVKPEIPKECKLLTDN